VPAYATADHVALYAPVRGELDTAPLFRDLRSRGKTVLYPRICDTSRLLSFHIVTGESQLQPSGLGIPEPGPGQAVVPLHRIDVFVVPGLAFDLQGQRLGWGHGYYDTTLGAVPSSLRVGYAYEFQVVPKVPATADDEHMDLLCTPARTLLLHARPHPQRRRNP
jgi:5-formyltetrahydrofolate cyclo-ligase